MSLTLTHKHEAQPPQNGGNLDQQKPRNLSTPNLNLLGPEGADGLPRRQPRRHQWLHCPMMGGTKMSITTSFFSLDFWDFLRKIFYQFLTLGIPLSPWPCQKL